MDLANNAVGHDVGMWPSPFINTDANLAKATTTKLTVGELVYLSPLTNTSEIIPNVTKLKATNL